MEDRKYDVAIFDFDGTLVDTEPIWWAVHLATCERLGVYARELEYSYEQWKDEFSNTRMSTIADVLMKRYHLEEEISNEHFRKLRTDIYVEYLTGHTQMPRLDYEPFEHFVNDDIVDALKTYHSDGTHCFLVSRNYGIVIVPTLAQLKLDEYFEDVITNCTTPSLAIYSDKNEPKAASFARAARWYAREGDPARCIVYDDSDKHIDTAELLGMSTVKVS